MTENISQRQRIKNLGVRVHGSRVLGLQDSQDYQGSLMGQLWIMSVSKSTELSWGRKILLVRVRGAAGHRG